ncbi:MAG: glycosyl transferase [Treponema sp.]|nr:glycosyl transferase [Treponema sp.]
MKYVYVLVSGEKDYYYEQALMSAYSMRLHNKNAHVIVLVDNKTNASFTGKREALKDYVDEIISVDFDESVPNVDRSRLIKTSIPEYVAGDFLYIDCDTIITSDLSEIEDTNKYPFATAGILDGHTSIEEHIHKDYFLARDKKLGFTACKNQGYSINGGLVLCRDSEEGKELFKKWNELWKYSAYEKNDKHDQSALNEANWRTGNKMQLLPGEWNCQPGHGGLAYLENAKIIHYFSSEMSGRKYIPYYKLAQKDIQQRIKDEGKIPEDIKDMIKKPKFLFNPVHIVNDSRIVSIMQSPIIFTMSDIKAKFPKLFSLMEKQASFIRNLGKRFLK